MPAHPADVVSRDNLYCFISSEASALLQKGNSLNTSNTRSNPTPASVLSALSATLASLVESRDDTTFAVLGRHGRAVASAVIWRTGILVTAAHVFRRVPQTVRLMAGDGSVLEATLVGSDAATDLAVFRMPESANTEVLPPGPQLTAVRTGELVVAVGRSADAALNASHGMVHRSAGPWVTWLGGALDQHIRLDGGLHDGLSGAAVCNADGALIGIASAALIRGFGAVIPAVNVSRVVDKLLESGAMPRPYLGVSVQAVATVRDAQTVAGLLVTGLADTGPAKSAGILVGDILTSVDGRILPDLASLRAALSASTSGAIDLGIVRGGVASRMALTVGQHPHAQAGCHRPC